MEFSKVYWVSSEVMDVIKKDLYENNIVISKRKSTSNLHKITVTYEIDREITIKESEFEKYLQEWDLNTPSISVTDYLKRKLFGGGENE